MSNSTTTKLLTLLHTIQGNGSFVIAGKKKIHPAGAAHRRAWRGGVSAEQGASSNSPKRRSRNGKRMWGFWSGCGKGWRGNGCSLLHPQLQGCAKTA